MNIQRLPTEVLHRIVRSLDRKDAYRCLFVSSTWFEAAVPVIYEHIILNGEAVDDLNEPEDPWMRSPFETYRKHVKSVKFHDDDLSPPLDYNRFASIIMLWPKLQRLDLYYSEYADGYLNCLKDNPNIQLDHLQEIIVDIYFRRRNGPMEDISLLVLLTSLKFRKSLTHLKAFEKFPADYNSEDKELHPLHLLPSFESLTQLFYCNIFTKSLTPARIQDIKPNLTSLDFHAASFYNDDIVAATPLIQKSDILKNLKISFRDITAPFIENLITNMPSHLKNFELHSSKEYDWCRWIERQGIDSALQLGSILNKIQNLSLTVNGTFLFDPEEMESSFSLANVRKPIFYKFLNRIIQDRKFASCHIIYSNLYLCSRICILGDPGNQKLVYSSYYNQDNAPELDQDSTLERVDIVTSLSYTSFRMGTPFPERGLEFFMIKYPNLERLEMYGGETFGLQLRDKFTTLDLNKLILTENISKTLNTYAPNIDTIWYKMGNVDNTNAGHYIFIDLSGYKKLQTFSFSAKPASNQKANGILVLQFAYKNGVDEYYMISRKENDKSKFTTERVTAGFISNFKNTPLEIGKVHFQFDEPINKIVVCNDSLYGNNVLAHFSLGQPVPEPDALVNLPFPRPEVQYNRI